MVDRKASSQTRKRLAKALQDDFWDCSVCTYKNSPEAFKCSVCDVRKGTSTRKPRLNQQIVAQQEATRLVTITQVPQATLVHPAKKLKEESDKSPEPSEYKKRKRKKKARCHIKGIDRSSADTYTITVRDSSITFTEFKPKK
ncbi:YY1-associated factor 2-like [Styela clava]|uniref:YY1-associated factor 2-like n=1 Tax=Styela clava TaxID=7725 RepID=UPI00193A1139|nr:YY1-associated factor 2-like [Styela clava]